MTTLSPRLDHYASSRVLFEDRTKLPDQLTLMPPERVEYDLYEQEHLKGLKSICAIQGIGRTTVSIVLQAIEETMSRSIKDYVTKPTAPVSGIIAQLILRKKIHFDALLNFCLINSYAFMNPEIARSEEFKDWFIKNVQEVVEQLDITLFKEDSPEEFQKELYDSLLTHLEKHPVLDLSLIQKTPKKTKDRLVIVSHDGGYGHLMAAEAIARNLSERNFQVLHLHLSGGAPIIDDLEKVALRIAEFGPCLIFSTGYERILWGRTFTAICQMPVIEVVTDYFLKGNNLGEQMYSPTLYKFPNEALSGLRTLPSELQADIMPELSENMQTLQQLAQEICPEHEENYFTLGFPTRFTPLSLSDSEQLQVRKEVFGITDEDMLRDPKIPVCTFLFSSRMQKQITTFMQLQNSSSLEIDIVNSMKSPALHVLQSLYVYSREGISKRFHIHVIFGRANGEKRKFDEQIMNSSHHNDLVTFSTADFTKEMDKVYAASKLLITMPSGATSAEIFQQKDLRVLWIKPGDENPLELTNRGNALLFEKKGIGRIYKTSCNPYPQIMGALESDDALPRMDVVDWKKQMTRLLQERGVLEEGQTHLALPLAVE